MLSDECHSTTFTYGRYGFVTLDNESKQLLELRCGVSVDHCDKICLHHEQVYLKKFGVSRIPGLNPKKCSNPFSKENHKSCVTGQRNITVEMSLKAKKYEITVKPGLKVCINCRKELFARLNEAEKREEEQLLSSDTDDEAALQRFQREQAVSSANKALRNVSCDISPINMHSVSWERKRSRESTVKRKMFQVKNKLDTVKKRVTTNLAESFDLEPDAIELHSDDKEKSQNLDEIINMVKEKLESTESYRSKLQLLTISPPSWSIRKIVSTFNVTSHMARKAIQLRNEGGILNTPAPKRGNPLPVSTCNLVKEFYYENSRVLPGMKDTVSIKRNVKVQKRLILCNLNELYAEFQKTHPAIKLGLAKFCQLRPKECVTVGASGSHSVCVCAIHKNVELMHFALNIKQSLHDLVEMIVCSRENKECMLHRCENCPGVVSMLEKLKKEVVKQHLGDDACDEEVFSYFNEEEIKYSQWTSTDRADLENHYLLVGDFLDTFAMKVDASTAHSYITKEQNMVFKETKANLTEKQAVAVLDFAENYKFIVQDEIQSFHWNNKQCTLHPAAIYLKIDGEVQEFSMCVLSDDMFHDYQFVKKVMDCIVEYIEELNSSVELINYFSDGCAKQYKNCCNFLNVCLHKTDYGIYCKWNFLPQAMARTAVTGLGDQSSDRLEELLFSALSITRYLI